MEVFFGVGGPGGDLVVSSLLSMLLMPQRGFTMMESRVGGDGANAVQSGRGSGAGMCR